MREQIVPDTVAALRLIDECTQGGDYLLGIEIAEGLLHERRAQLNGNTSLNLQKKLAHSLTQAGLLDRAEAILRQLCGFGAYDSETWGLLGSVYKIRSQHSPFLDQQINLRIKSRDFYLSGFGDRSSVFCGINAAALSLLLDEKEKAKELAAFTITAASLKAGFWNLAAEAEATLIMGRLDSARELYIKANSIAAENRRWVDIATIRTQARELCHKLELDEELLESCFPSGSIGFFVGHMIDAPDRAGRRFPSSAIPSVEQRIRDWLKSQNILCTYSSAACGGDILFLENAQALNIETHVILPFDREFFVKSSVEKHGGEEWTKRFESVLANSASIKVLNEDMPDATLSTYEFSNRIVAAQASARAAIYDMLPPKGLALWNREIGDGRCNTATAVAYWMKGKVPVQVIHPTEPERDGVCTEVGIPSFEKAFPRIYTADPAGIQTRVASLLLLQISGYQKLRERDFTLLFHRLFGALAEVIIQQESGPARYGYGGRYLFLWESVHAAGATALQFMSVLQSRKSEWPAEVDFKFCLHTAPVQVMVNPVLNQYAHEGSALAKLEALAAKVLPGIVYATESFASLASFEKIADFNCKYSGTVALSNQSVATRMYHVT